MFKISKGKTEILFICLFPASQALALTLAKALAGTLTESLLQLFFLYHTFGSVHQLVLNLLFEFFIVCLILVYFFLLNLLQKSVLHVLS